MKGIVFLGDRKLEVRDFPDPAPGPREVVVQMKASGMCGSDLPPYRSEKPLAVVRGHEPCGVVVARGSAVTEDEAPIDQRVMIHHYSGCGLCKYCRVGYSQMCITGKHLVYGATANGGHAEYMTVTPSMLVPLDDALSFEQGASISCGTGTAFDALRRLDVSGRDTLAIYGQGPVGLSATMLAKAMGARVIAVDFSPERRKLASDFGADTVIDPAADEPVAAIKDLTHGEGADHDARLHRQPGRACERRQERRALGSRLLRRRRQHRYVQRQPGHHPQAADHLRLMDLQQRRPGRVRAVHRRPRH